MIIAYKFQTLKKKILLGAALVSMLILGLHEPAFAQEETGNVCVRDYRSGAVCTANDVRIEEMRFVNLVEGCNEGTIGQLTAVFELLISADGSPNRWDIGLFVDLSGSPLGARDGDSCYHTYLDPPLTASPVYGDYNLDTVPDILNGPWWDGSGDADTCGDIETNTQLFKTLSQITLVCADNTLDGAADVHVCTSWDNNVGSACNDVTQAFPGTNSKCSCTYVELPFTPTQIEMMDLQARSGNQRAQSAAIIIALSSLSLLLTIGVVLRFKRR